MKEHIKRIIKDNPIYKVYHQYKLSIYYENKYREEQKKNQYLLEHFDPKDMRPAIGYLRFRQRKIMEFANEVIGVLNTIGITPFLIGGNLIGWMRHGGFVPWDDDLDFGIFRKDYEELLEYAKRHWIVLECPTKDNLQQEWIDKATKENAGKFILFIYAAHIQISCGYSCMDRRCVDFFIYEYYDEEADFGEFNEKVKCIKERLNKCNSEHARLEIVRDELDNEQRIKDKSCNIYFGLDSCEPYLRTFNSSWIDFDIVFPLRVINYEGVLLSIPNKPELFMNYEYPNWRELPADCGRDTHGYWDTYKKTHLITVEFYLVDSFEIFHFIPFYNYFRKKGIYAVFVSEPPERNKAGEWFDYKKAISLLNEYELEYKEECYPDANYAFTTQRAEVLEKYTGKKINITYGCGLIKNQFAFMSESFNGFDYKFVHGTFTKELCKRNLGERIWEKNKDRVFLMGYPKWKRKEINKFEVLDELDIKTSKKIIGYFPTWGKHSCIKEYHDVLCSLKEHYFIVSKPHHCTARLDSEMDNLKMLNECSDLVLPSDYDTEKALSIFDIVICSAESGVSLECAWLNPDIKMILVTKEKKIEDVFFEEIFRVAYIVNDPLRFMVCFNKVIDEDKFIPFRKEFSEMVFGMRDYNYLDDIYLKIIGRVEK